MKAVNPAHVAAFPPELPPTRRYTLGGEPAAEHQVLQDLSRLAADVDAELRPALVALVLIGRFARGEGGVVLSNGEPHAHPSYRCLAVLADDDDDATRLARRLAQRWSNHLGVPVFLHCHARATLRRARKTLWWLDIARGNAEVLCGDRQVLQNVRACDVGDLPSDEAGWLITQAAAELALAPRTADDGVAPLNASLHKAVLSCGDATLLLAGRFGSTLQSRETQLAGLGVATERVSAYHAATVYLGRPGDAPSPSEPELRGRLAMVARWHMEIEHGRRGAPLSPSAFPRHRGRLFDLPKVAPTRPTTWLRWWLRSSAEFPYVGDDRERLARAAVALAYLQEDRGCRLMATRLLRLSGSGESDAAISLALGALLSRVRHETQRDAVDGGFYS
ncbi:MAG: hypothetical protein OXU20_24785 [Myxococcales bacterium]|nr:hypothetical protein [Myxococcales bacterium]MDD9969894.1 hypothetical protein [Myxococcales bacterium]